MLKNLFSTSAQKSSVARWFAAGLAGAVLLQPCLGHAASRGPFSQFAGEWRGAGQVVASDGHSETIACRAAYTVASQGTSLNQALVCASDSYRFDITSDVVANGDTFQGRWQEKDRNLLGDLTGQINRGDFEGSVTGQGFTAQIEIKANEHKQVVSIRPSGGGISDVEVSLSRQR